MKNIITCLLCIFVICLNAQEVTRLDSLLAASKTDKGTELVHSLNEISWEFKASYPDSAIYYAKKALKVARSINEEKAEASALNSLASAFETKNELDSALYFNEKSLEIKKKIQDTIGIANTYNNLGIIADTKGNYNKALEYYFEALEIYEMHAKEFNKIPMVLVNIGIVYKKQKDYQKVLDYYQRALKIYQDNKYQVGEVITSGNIGSVLLNLQEHEKSIEYSLKARALYEKLGYNRYVPYMDANIGIAKDSLKQYDEAEKLYRRAIKAYKRDSNLYELTHTNILLGNNLLLNKKANQAKTYLDEALQLARTNSFNEFEIKALKYIAKADALNGKYRNAYSSLNAYSRQKDSVFETEKTKIAFELESKYETQKKERQILTQRAEIAEQGLKLQKRNYQIYGLGAFALFLALLGYLFYNQQKLKNVQLVREKELFEALTKIETQNRLQEQRLRISRDLHDNIGAQLTFIISSIDNLKYGFELPKKLEQKLEGISSFTGETIYELRDTIWAMNKNQITFEDLQSRISNFIDKANASSDGIKFSFNVSDSVDDTIVFSAIEGMNMYRIIQEALNNSIKHASAKALNVEVNQVDEKLTIEISDDGKGYDLKNVVEGNGLNNMKKRAADIGGELLILSDNTSGTEVHFTKPLNA